MKRIFGVAAAFLFIFAAFAGCMDDEVAANERPIADIRIDNVEISNGTYSTSINVPVRFNATGSLDIDGEIKSYQWNFDDGGLGYSPEVSHIFLDEGTFIVKLIVTDDDGDVDSDMVIVNVVGEASFGVRMDVATKSHRTSPGRDTDFAVIVTNTGNTEDTFKFQAGSDLPVGWTFKASGGDLTLLPGESELRIVTIKTSTTASKVNHEVSFKVISSTDENSFASATVNVDVKNPGVGPATEGDLVQCQYIGWFTDGEVFDSSLETFKEGRGDTPLKVSLGDTSASGYTTVIPGFKNALVGMYVGETNVVLLTPEEGYNDGQYRVFEIELVSIDS